MHSLLIFLVLMVFSYFYYCHDHEMIWSLRSIALILVTDSFSNVFDRYNPRLSFLPQITKSCRRIILSSKSLFINLIILLFCFLFNIDFQVNREERVKAIWVIRNEKNTIRVVRDGMIPSAWSLPSTVIVLKQRSNWNQNQNTHNFWKEEFY
jgi:hypothetical protein